MVFVMMLMLMLIAVLHRVVAMSVVHLFFLPQSVVMGVSRVLFLFVK